MRRVEIVDGLAAIVEWEIRAVVAPIGEVDLFEPVRVATVADLDAWGPAGADVTKAFERIAASIRGTAPEGSAPDA